MLPRPLYDVILQLYGRILLACAHSTCNHYSRASAIWVAATIRVNTVFIHHAGVSDRAVVILGYSTHTNNYCYQTICIEMSGCYIVSQEMFCV